MATYYIDPSAAVNGSGTIGSPYNTWVGVPLTANNTYLQKRGTTYTGASVRPQSQSSSAATPLTVGAYYNSDGSDDTTQPRPIINHNGGTNGVGAVFVDTCTNVIVQDIAGTASSAALGGAVTTRRSVGVLIQRCTGYGNEHGFCIQQDQASATTVTTDITIQDCVAYNNVSGGITLRWGTVSTAVLRRIKLLRNTIYSNGTGKGFGSGGTSVPCGGISSYTQNKASIGTAGFISYDIVCDQNTVYNNNGYGINIEGFATDTRPGSVSRNTATGNGYSGDVDSHSLWVGNSSGIIIERNLIHDNSANVGASTGSGVGIFLDYNASSTSGGANCIVRQNTIYSQFQGSTAAPAIAAGAGILVLSHDDSLIESNLIYDCRNGISVGNGTATDGTLVYNNTVIDCLNSGINVLPLGTNTIVKNNVVVGPATGLFVNTTSTAGYAESYNAVYGCAVAKANGTATAQTPTSLDATDITANPLLTSDYKPTASSPLLGAGTHLGYIRDMEGKQCKKHIGAYGYARVI